MVIRFALLIVIFFWTNCVFAQNQLIVLNPFNTGYESPYRNEVLRDSIRCADNATYNFRECRPLNFIYLNGLTSPDSVSARINIIENSRDGFDLDSLRKRPDDFFVFAYKKLNDFIDTTLIIRPTIYKNWKIISKGVEKIAKKRNRYSIWAVAESDKHKIFVKVIFSEMPVDQTHYLQSFCMTIRKTAVPRYERLALELMDCFE